MKWLSRHKVLLLRCELEECTCSLAEVTGTSSSSEATCASNSSLLLSSLLDSKHSQTTSIVWRFQHRTIGCCATCRKSPAANNLAVDHRNRVALYSFRL
ncbi:hypothetical protein GGR55DRAFT_82433 [Xylaria sp. FL0064]|nr:hypothetical protein GGR55DRAFT_82433 [Xylaria sp. FL0064]